GRRFDRTKLDQEEQNYVACYPLTYTDAENARMLSQVAQELIERRRELMTLKALGEVITGVGATTQARTTVLTVTEGWALYRPDKTLLEPRMYNENDPARSPIEGPPGGERIGITRGGKLGVKDPADLTSVKYACEADRLRLANIDDRQDFQDLWRLANRHNVSFYTIDPRGLTAFDTEVQVDPPRGVKNGLDWDRRSLEDHQGAMRDLANNTDGLAIMDSLQFDRNLQRIIDDLASYYLLGYYSTNPKLDGKYREITVRVKRRDVDVRARRGYRAPTAEEVEAGKRTTAAAAARPATAALPKPTLFRRGPATGNRLEPASGTTFSRTERLHVELRLELGMTNPAARFLDRVGQPMALPVTTGERTDADGTRWLTADVTLAPLAPGTYAIELAATDATGVRTISTPIQVTR
ncbi:MAG TPA: VWA domain-containing protein, partial [Vicinamibacterales bacterium]